MQFISLLLVAVFAVLAAQAFTIQDQNNLDLEPAAEAINDVPEIHPLAALGCGTSSCASICRSQGRGVYSCSCYCSRAFGASIEPRNCATESCSSFCSRNGKAWDRCSCSCI